MSAVAVQLEEPALAWVDVCALDDILPDTGVAALVGGRQIAIVRVGESDGDGAEVYALDNFDPFSHAFVIARGIVGDRGGIPKIASPIFKQSFDLRTGQCLDDPAVRLASFQVRVTEGRIRVVVPGDDPAGGT
ncbi:MAG TPA: nitrite reductase small subunit NirD [Polyangia bacterium]|jgi:nitrite reductase (NADH) small subunit|nr:nitrite reductase small subunit NirD [Polyangia bacterium]